MALWKNNLRARRGMRTSTALVTLAAVIGLATPAMAQFPGSKWSVDYVRVEGDAPAGVASAVNFGLRMAGETYFYGGVPTQLVATVRDASLGIVDIKLVDSNNGSVIGERRGLTFAPTQGDVAPGSGPARAISNTIKFEALSWMGGLGCGDECAVALNDSAVVQVAEVTETPVVTEAPTPDPEPVEQAEPVIAAVEAAAPEARVDAKPVVAPKPEAEPVTAAKPIAEPKPALEPTTAPIPSKAAQPVLAEAPKTPEPVVKPSVAAEVAKPQTRAAKVEAPKVDSDAPTVAAASDDGKPATPTVSLASPDVSSARKLDNQTREEIAAIVRGASETAPTVAPTASEPVISSVTPVPRPSAPDQDRGLEFAAASQATEAPVLPAPRLAEPSTGEAASLAGVPLASDTIIADAPPDAQPSAVTAPPAAETTSPRTLDNTVSQAPEAPVETTASDAVQLPTPLAPESPTVAGADAPAAPQNETPDEEPPVIARIEEGDVQVNLVNPAAQTGGADLGASSLPGENTDVPEPRAAEGEPAEALLAGGGVKVILPEAPAAADPAQDVKESDDLDGEVLALADPTGPVTPPEPIAGETSSPAADAADSAPDLSGATPPADGGSSDPETKVETQIAAVDPTAEGPTLANARWVGFTPAVFTGSDQREGTWISGPFDRKQRTGWITDTATGATTQVTFIWRDAASGGRTATLSRAAAKALGLGQGDVANVAVYLPR